MASRARVHAVGATSQELPGPEVGESRELLRVLFRSTTVGVGICDRALRFCAVNDALAAMNGIPASEHIGKTLQAVLGEAAQKVQPAFEHVFATGQPLSDFEVTAELPSRTGLGHWRESYVPIKNQQGQVLQVGAVVLELTKRTELDSALRRLTGNLARMTGALPGGRYVGGPATKSITELENCMEDVRTISRLLSGAPPLIAVWPSGSQRPAARPMDDVSLASVNPIEPELGYVCPLSLREQEVTVLLARGKSNKEIATILTISTRTVEAHRARVMLKLNLRSLSELIRYAVRRQMVSA